MQDSNFLTRTKWHSKKLEYIALLNFLQETKKKTVIKTGKLEPGFDV